MALFGTGSHNVVVRNDRHRRKLRRTIADRLADIVPGSRAADDNGALLARQAFGDEHGAVTVSDQDVCLPAVRCTSPRSRVLLGPVERAHDDRAEVLFVHTGERTWIALPRTKRAPQQRHHGDSVDS